MNEKIESSKLFLMNSYIKISYRKLLFIIIIFLNILPLLWFKYSAFIIDNIILLFNLELNFNPPSLPLGISFYTFIQLAWLYDIYSKNIKRESFQQYLLFSCGFPWLISGPIVRAKDLVKQLSNLSPLSVTRCAQACSLFSIGLAKKIILADTCGLYADNVFNAAYAGWPISFLEAWAGSLFYTFQLYFDFSGYTDMALSLGLLIGLNLPENFNSPYKASGIIDFWRRWHMTLGAWLRDFIYIPLGGNRKGKIRQYLNLFFTMLLGGIWHGAGWTYILWGAMHGFMLIINHAWYSWRKSHDYIYLKSKTIKIFSISFTFICINLSWVIFRANDLDSALHLYKSMFSLNLAAMQNSSLASLLNMLIPHHYISGWQPAFLLFLCAFICWSMPTSNNLLIYMFKTPQRSIILTRLWAFYCAVIAFLALIFSGHQSNFLYFQF